MKFAQLHYFLSQNRGGEKRYYVPFYIVLYSSVRSVKYVLLFISERIFDQILTAVCFRIFAPAFVLA